MAEEERRPEGVEEGERTQFAVGDRAPFKGPGPKRSDEDIRSDVVTALFYDEAVSSIEVNVAVQDGTVELTGKVDSELAKRRAFDDAWRVSGVRAVKNNLIAAETPTPSRAAGQDLVEAKPPEPIYGEPVPAAPENKPAQPQTSPPSSGAEKAA